MGTQINVLFALLALACTQKLIRRRRHDVAARDAGVADILANGALEWVKGRCGRGKEWRNRFWSHVGCY